MRELAERALGLRGIVLIDWDSCSMRALSASAAAWVRVSIWLVTVSARPTSRSSKRPMRLSRVLATSWARAPRVWSISADLAAMASATSVPRAMMVPATSADALVEHVDDLLAAGGEVAR